MGKQQRLIHENTGLRQMYNDATAKSSKMEEKTNDLKKHIRSKYRFFLFLKQNEAKNCQR